MSVAKLSARVGAAAFTLGLSLAGPPATGIAAADSADSATSAESGRQAATTTGASAGAAHRTGPRDAAESARSGSTRSTHTPPRPAATLTDAMLSDTDVVEAGHVRRPSTTAAPSPTAVRSAAAAGIERRRPRAEASAARAGSEQPQGALPDNSVTAPGVGDRATETPAPAAVRTVATASVAPAGLAVAPAAPAAIAAQPAARVLSGPDQILADATVRFAQVFDRVGDWLSLLPANPITDLLSGALLLVRRNLLPNVPVIPSVTVSTVTVPEGDIGTTTHAVFTVTLDKAHGTAITVGYATSDTDAPGGAATAQEDYTPVAGMLTFFPGETSKSVLVPVIGDNSDEPAESFGFDVFATLSARSPEVGPVLTGVPLGSATGTIVKGDNACGCGATSPIPNTVKVEVNRAPALTYAVNGQLIRNFGQGNRAMRGVVITPITSDPDGDATVALCEECTSERPLSRVDTGVGVEGFRFFALPPDAWDGKSWTGGIPAPVLLATDGTDYSTIVATGDLGYQGKSTPAAPALTVSEPDPDTGAYMITLSADDSVTVSVTTSAPAFGSLVANGTGSYTYVPKADHPGDVDTVRFTATDRAGSTSSSSVTFSVLPGKDPATAVPVLTARSEQDPDVGLTFGTSDRRTGSMVITPTINPTGLYIDAALANRITVTVVGEPERGVVVANRDGTYTYTPETLTGVGDTDTVTFEFNDGRDTIILNATAVISVADFNHPPVLELTTHVLGGHYTGYRVIAIKPIATDPDDDAVSVALTGYTSKTENNGVIYKMPLGEIWYGTPAYRNGFYNYRIDKNRQPGETDTITLTATDSHGLTTSTTTTVVIP